MISMIELWSSICCKSVLSYCSHHNDDLNIIYVDGWAAISGNRFQQNLCRIYSLCLDFSNFCLNLYTWVARFTLNPWVLCVPLILAMIYSVFYFNFTYPPVYFADFGHWSLLWVHVKKNVPFRFGTMWFIWC